MLALPSCGENVMLTFIVGLSLGACLGVVIAGICRSVALHEAEGNSGELTL
jgi:hypothetical protein